MSSKLDLVFIAAFEKAAAARPRGDVLVDRFFDVPEPKLELARKAKAASAPFATGTVRNWSEEQQVRRGRRAHQAKLVHTKRRKQKMGKAALGVGVAATATGAYLAFRKHKRDQH
jgi:hypothetical protein